MDGVAGRLMIFIFIKIWSKVRHISTLIKGDTILDYLIKYNIKIKGALQDLDMIYATDWMDPKWRAWGGRCRLVLTNQFERLFCGLSKIQNG